MRSLIENRQLLAESTFNMNKDVDYIYSSSGLKELVDAIESGNEEDAVRIFKEFDRGKVWKTNSSKLRSRVAKKAHKLKPVKIVVGLFGDGSYYMPEKSEISISLSTGGWELLRGAGYHLEIAKMMVGHQAKRFAGEFGSKSIKGTIYHELSHWADDALHGFYITKKLDVAKEHGRPGQVKGKFSKSTHTPLELNAQVHAVKEIRRQIGKREFDKMMWRDLFQAKASIMANFMWFDDAADYMDTMKRFVKRLNREGLLGKKLRKIPSYQQMQLLQRLV